jgi:tight adherence protein C
MSTWDHSLELLLGAPVWAAAAAMLLIALAGVAAAGAGRSKDRRDQRLRALHDRRVADEIAGSDRRTSSDPGSLTGARMDGVGRLARRLAAWLRPGRVATRDSLNRLRQLLRSAGVHDDSMVALLLVSKAVAAAFGVLAGLAAQDLVPGLRGTPTAEVLLALIGGLAGSLLPEQVLKLQARRRQVRLATQLPDALDLLVICAESGLTLERGLGRAGVEISLAAPELGQELSATAADMRIAPSRVQALENLATRTQVPEIESVTTTLIQSQKYGTGLAQSLRALSAEIRTNQMRQIEERAAKLPTLISLPLVLLVLPALCLIILGPAIADLIQVLL